MCMEIVAFTRVGKNKMDGPLGGKNKHHTHFIIQNCPSNLNFGCLCRDNSKSILVFYKVDWSWVWKDTHLLGDPTLHTGQWQQIGGDDMTIILPKLYTIKGVASSLEFLTFVTKIVLLIPLTHGKLHTCTSTLKTNKILRNSWQELK